MAHVLVVEDNTDNLTLMCDILDALGYSTSVAGNGAEGIVLAQQQQPDLILMDLSMPQMDGWTATRLLKDDPTTAHIPVIALTAHAMAGDRERALAAGADDYVTKPIALKEFSLKIREYLP
ncbi:MAG: response regulator [Chloroflexota bacterium]|nr:response regulator [Chloroflexota bacterium]